MLGICKVPVITPLFVYWPNQLGNKEAYDSCCEVTLLCYKPGTRPGNVLWKNLEDETAGKFDDKHEAMLDFVNDPQSKCPKFIRADFLNALKRRDNLLLQALHEMERDADENHDSIEDEEDQGVDMFADLLDGGEHDYQIDDNDEMNMLIEAMQSDESITVLTHDTDHDWHEDRIVLELDDTMIEEAGSWLQEKRATSRLDSGDADQAVFNPEQLQPSQLRVFNAAKDALDNVHTQRFLDVCGGAGTGKSFTINTIVKYAKETYGESSVQVISPSGAAASQFKNGRTIHSYLKITTSKARGKDAQDKAFKELSDASAQALEQELADLRLLIVDEKGMLGFSRLFQISSRLQQARPMKKDVPFGGISVLLGGDLKQLPPVFDTPLYNYLKLDVTAKECDQIGRLLYGLFKDTYYLLEQMRQHGEANRVFKEELDRLGNCTFTRDDYDRWEKKLDYEKLTPEEQREFYETATLLAGRKVDLKNFNNDAVKRLGNPICIAQAVNNPVAAKTFQEDQADGLFNDLALCHGSPVLLIKNKWPQAGLVNGSRGVVRFILFKSTSCTGPGSIPDLLLVEFPKYIGPSYRPGYEKLVPIAPDCASWTTPRKEMMQRRQFPIIPGSALTIHKAQGKKLINIETDMLRNEYHFLQE